MKRFLIDSSHMRRWLAGILLGASSAGLVQAQGLGDFSAPPPKRVEPKPPPSKPVERPRPSPRPRRPAKPSYEDLSWFSRTLLCAGDSQRCEEAATWPLRTGFEDDYFLRLTLPVKHCSPVYLDVEFDGRLLGSSGLLDPGRTTVLTLGKVTKGNHVVRISALGRVGGCNRGQLQSWGIDLALSNNPSHRALAKAPLNITNAQRLAAMAQTAQPSSAKASETEDAAKRSADKAEEAERPSQRGGSAFGNWWGALSSREREEPAKSSGKKTSTADTIHVVNVGGRELTGLNAYSLYSSLTLAKDRGAQAVAVNLERVTYMTDPGVDALIKGERLFGQGNLVLVNLTGEPRRVLETRLPGHFAIYASKQAAIGALQGR